MNKANYGPKYTKRLTLRLTDEQFEAIVKLADILGVLPSEFLRMTVNMYMHSYNSPQFQAQFGAFTDSNRKEELNVNEHVETNQHDIV